MSSAAYVVGRYVRGGGGGGGDSSLVGRTTGSTTIKKEGRCPRKDTAPERVTAAGEATMKERMGLAEVSRAPKRMMMRCYSGTTIGRWVDWMEVREV